MGEIVYMQTDLVAELGWFHWRAKYFRLYILSNI